MLQQSRKFCIACFHIKAYLPVTLLRSYKLGKNDVFHPAYAYYSTIKAALIKLNK